jgi:hypothetical protein
MIEQAYLDPHLLGENGHSRVVTVVLLFMNVEVLLTLTVEPDSVVRPSTFFTKLAQSR